MKQASDKNNVIRNNFYILKMIFTATPVFAGTFILFGIMGGLMQFINNIYFIRTITNQVQAKDPFNRMIATLLAFALLNAAYMILNNVFHSFFIPIAKIRLAKNIQEALLQKAVSIRVSSFDDPQFYDGYILSMTVMDKKVFAVLETFAELLKSAMTALLTLRLIFIIDPFCLGLVILSLIVSALGGGKLNGLLFRRKSEMMVYRRKMDYTDRLFYLGDYAKEIRVNQIAGMLIEDYKKAVRDIRRVIAKYSAPIVLFAHLEDISTLFFDVIYVTSLVLRLVLKGLITVGDFVSMINSAWTLSNNIRAIAKQVNELNDHSIYIGRYRTFLSATDEPDPGDKLLEGSAPHIRFHDVQFCYPNEEKDVLNGVTFGVKPHEKIALVGYNGSGKSTLVKLLLRLYEPRQGGIDVDGFDAKAYSLNSYRAGFGAVFQDYNLYEVSLAENIAMEEADEPQYGRVRDAISAVRLFAGNGPEDALFRHVGKEFDENGSMLSGGESQKIAIARVIYSSRDIIVLDEPSAALDPESEYYFNKLITEKLAFKTVIIISHRLSTTRMMDKVFMMEKGKIIESGTHNELMELKGKYAQMYKVQALRYGVSE